MENNGDEKTLFVKLLIQFALPIWHFLKKVFENKKQPRDGEYPLLHIKSYDLDITADSEETVKHLPAIIYALLRKE